MIKTLRTRHKNIWLLFTISTFSLIILAITNIPKQAQETSFNSESNVSEPIVKEYQLDNLKVNLRGSQNNVEVLELVVLTPFKSASTELSIIFKDGGTKKLGQVGSTGIYHFKIDSNKADWQSIELFDFIKNIQIAKINV